MTVNYFHFILHFFFFYFQTLSVEFIHDKEGKDQIKEFMSNLGYEVVKEVTDPNWLANDFIFNKIN